MREIGGIGGLSLLPNGGGVAAGSEKMHETGVSLEICSPSATVLSTATTTTGRRCGHLEGGATASTTIVVADKLIWSSRRPSVANSKHGRLAGGGRGRQALQAPSPSNSRESRRGATGI